MPTRLFMSSGDMLADRRFDYARDLQISGDLAGAAELLEQATELAPGFASAWFTLGDIREQLGDRDSAIAAFRNAARTDEADRNGAGLRLIRLGAAAPSPIPPTYVAALFDQYAPKFESSLVEDLGYRGPDLLFKAVLNARRTLGKPALFRHAVDLGCGTGIIGMDLSPRMIERARATGLYAELDVADMVEGLARRSAGSADLVLAADVMIYLSDLAPVLGEIARVLKPNGLLAFTTETHDDDGAGGGVVLGHGLRYAHSARYVTDAVAASGLTLRQLEHAWARTENHVPAPGLVVVATKG